AGNDENHHHQRQQQPTLKANVTGHLGQRNGADPQPQQGQDEGGLKSEAQPAIARGRGLVATNWVHTGASSGWSDGSAGRIQRCTNIQKANNQPTTSNVPP